MRKHHAWANKHMTGPREDTWEDPVVWEVTLFINTGNCEIHWEAIEKNSEEYKSELLYDDPKILMGGNVEEAEDTIRGTIEDDVVPELFYVSNLNDVLERQVPAMIQKLRQQED